MTTKTEAFLMPFLVGILVYIAGMLSMIYLDLEQIRLVFWR